VLGRGRLGRARIRRAGGLAAAGLAAFSAAASAVTLQISPVTIEMGPAAKGAAMTLTNPGTSRIFGQLRVYEWDQQDGRDVLRPTRALVASPPLLEVPAGGAQLVRLVRTDQGPTGKESSYRILIDEIPDENEAPGTGVQIRMRYSVPVLVDGGLSANDGPILSWTLTRAADYWQLRVDNRGSRRARISAISLRDAGGQRHQVAQGLLGYALAGRFHIWKLEIPASVELGADLEVHAEVNAHSIVAPADLAGQAVENPQGKER
jgi:fimbrial chaperone protein